MNKKNYFFLLILFLCIVIASSCDESGNDPYGDEMARLDAWKAIHNIETTPTPSGLYYISYKEGYGKSPADSNYVLYSCTAKTLDDAVFENTYKDSAKYYDNFSYSTHYVPSFKLYLGSIGTKGFYEGLSYMKEGGKARFIVPSNLGYGKNSTVTIPSYSTLVYDVELVKVIEDPDAYEKSLIANYLADHPGFTNINDSIYFMKTKEGTKECSILKDTVVSANYVGRYLDGFIFDTNIKSVAEENNILSSSKTYGATSFTVGSSGLTTGFSLALRQMIIGEKATIIVPSAYAYGVAGSSSIPPYTPLVFEIEVVDINPAK